MKFDIFYLVTKLKWIIHKILLPSDVYEDDSEELKLAGHHHDVDDVQMLLQHEGEEIVDANEGACPMCNDFHLSYMPVYC